MKKSINLLLLIAILLFSCSSNEQKENKNENVQKEAVKANSGNSNQDDAELKSKQSEENPMEKDNSQKSKKAESIQQIKSNIVNTVPYMGKQCKYDVQFEGCEIIVTTKCQNGDYLSTRTKLQSLNTNDIFKGKKDPREIGNYSKNRASNIVSSFSNNGTKSTINSNYLFLIAKSKDKADEIREALTGLINECK